MWKSKKAPLFLKKGKKVGGKAAGYSAVTNITSKTFHGMFGSLVRALVESICAELLCVLFIHEHCQCWHFLVGCYISSEKGYTLCKLDENISATAHKQIKSKFVSALKYRCARCVIWQLFFFLSNWSLPSHCWWCPCVLRLVWTVKSTSTWTGLLCAEDYSIRVLGTAK